MSTIHILKVWPDYYLALRLEIKTCEIRMTSDRDFRVGDILLLREFIPELERFTGRELYRKITFIDGLVHAGKVYTDFAILSVKPLTGIEIAREAKNDAARSATIRNGKKRRKHNNG